MTFKRFILFLATAWTATQLVHAVPAYPHPQVVTQADGSELTIIVRGDEHGHIAMTADGYPLYYNEDTGNYEYASLSANDVTGSGIVAADADKRDATAKAFLESKANSDKVFKAVASKRMARMATSTGNTIKRVRVNDFPTTGEPHSLVILVEFSNCAFTTVGDDAKDFYDRMLNQEGFTYTNGAEGSVHDYYVANSNGKFSPIFDVVGPVQLANTVEYYGGNSGGEDNYDRIAEMVSEACKAVDDDVDFSLYDYDSDGYVDNIYIFYAGYGESDSGKSSTIWPHSALLNSMLTSPLQLDGKTVNNYACSNEINGKRTGITAGIGVFTHEFSHVLGLGDHYDVYYSSATFTPGAYDVMCSGSYNNNGNTPPLFSAFERESLGWLEYTELTDEGDIVKALEELGTSNKAFRVSVAGNDNVFYTLENRQQSGWDKYIPGHGMLMWHIDIDETAWQNNEINTDASHQRVDLVEADNKRTSNSYDADPFPGTSNVTSWEMEAWDGTVLKTLDDINETDDGNIEIVLGGLDFKMTTPTITVDTITESSITLSWNSVDVADTYILNVYTTNDTSKTYIDGFEGRTFNEGTTVTIENLSTTTEYTISLSAKRGSYCSDTVTTVIATTAIPFTKLKPENVTAYDFSTSSFRASWSAVEEADGYEATLNKLNYSDDDTIKGYDFSDNETGLPELWDYSGSFVSVTGNYGQATPSLRFPKQGGFLTVAYPDARISGISFWGKGNASTDGNVYIERYVDEEWISIDSCSPTNEAQTYSFVFEPSDKIRIRLEDNSGVFYIDDVTATTHELTRTVAAQQTVGTTECIFTDLDKDTEYGLTVTALSNTERSASSAELRVNLSTALSVSRPTIPSSTTTQVYDMTGRKVASTTDALPHGIYIVRHGSKVIKQVVK